MFQNTAAGPVLWVVSDRVYSASRSKAIERQNRERGEAKRNS